MRQEARIYVAGHNGLAGSAILRRLRAAGYENIVTRAHTELDLTDARATADFFAAERPEYVFLAAAKVGGIHANRTYPAEFIRDNLAIQNHVLHQSHLHGVRRLIFLGSSCIYPALAPQPMREEYLLGGPLEPTNQAYAAAKIAGIFSCWAYNQQYGVHFLPVMPTNLYGPRDHFDLQRSHVLPALIRKFHLAKLAMQADERAIARDETVFGLIPPEYRSMLRGRTSGGQPPLPEHKVLLWGSGTPRREFLYCDDLADALLFLMNLAWEEVVAAMPHPEAPLINIGEGRDQTIKDLAERIAKVVGYAGEIAWDPNMPDGVPQKLLDVSRLRQMGWQAAVDLEEGVRRTYRWYLEECERKALK
jgi:GDP-L-fucose synthase